jgi:hypothetical protein
MRLYLDTSVFGGCFDEGFKVPSLAVIEMICNGAAIGVGSDLLVEELEQAPDEVKALLQRIPAEQMEWVDADEKSEALCSAYITAGALGKASEDDALHVALASLAQVDAILSWNFKHIVNLNRMRVFHQVNQEWGLPLIEICSPFEVGEWQ